MDTSIYAGTIILLINPSGRILQDVYFMGLEENTGWEESVSKDLIIVSLNLNCCNLIIWHKLDC